MRSRREPGPLHGAENTSSRRGSTFWRRRGTGAPSESSQVLGTGRPVGDPRTLRRLTAAAAAVAGSPPSRSSHRVPDSSSWCADFKLGTRRFEDKDFFFSPSIFDFEYVLRNPIQNSCIYEGKMKESRIISSIYYRKIVYFI